MRIHIVCSRLHADRVLPRLARILAFGTNWSLSEEPDPDADLNYFFPYIELQHREWSETLTASWFTHKDIVHPKKEKLWNEVAARVDLRLTSAPMYLSDLRQYGPTHLVRPAVDRMHFNIYPKEKGRVIGVNGWCYGDDRKGEDLVKLLSRSKVGKTCQWKASGRDWPVPTQSYSWEQMPKFFQSLDLFVCASRIEGIPLPPLEALSCGIPIIIPKGVGLLDELPDVHGIYRFEVGNYENLCQTFAKAVKDDKPLDREALRVVTKPYSEYNWCQDHEEAFDTFLRGDVGDLPDWKGNSGVYIVAFGKPSRECAVRCIRSFKEHMPDIPVAFVGTEPLDIGEDIFIHHEDVDIGGRTAKLAIDRLAPKEWTYVLYLDADLEIKESLNFIYQLLESGWEFVICKDMHDRHWLQQMRRGDNEEEYTQTLDVVGTDKVMQYNGGLFGYRRSDRTKKFFGLWNEEYRVWLSRDQGALIRALYQYPLRIFLLCNQWNSSMRYEQPPGPIAVEHHNMSARRYGKKPGYRRLDSPEAWDMVKEWERIYLT